MTEQHAKFQNRLRSSSNAVAVVASWLNRKGKHIEIPSMRISPTADQASDYLDGGDLYIIEKKRVEVKHLGINFTSADDWPFREIFISNVAAVDRSFDQVSAWVSVSQDMGYIAVVKPDSREHWYISEKKASNTGNVESYYATNIKHVQFIKIN
jgi:hypothetical protein